MRHTARCARSFWWPSRLLRPSPPRSGQRQHAQHGCLHDSPVSVAASWTRPDVLHASMVLRTVPSLPVTRGMHARGACSGGCTHFFIGDALGSPTCSSRFFGLLCATDGRIRTMIGEGWCCGAVLTPATRRRRVRNDLDWCLDVHHPNSPWRHGFITETPFVDFFVADLCADFASPFDSYGPKSRSTARCTTPTS